MANHVGEGNTEVIILGWGSASNLTGKIFKDNVNNYFLNLNWTGTPATNNTTVKYFLIYEGSTFFTTDTNYTLPISYGVSEIDKTTGITKIKEVCITLETRFYFNDGTYSMGESKTFCFCPPADIYCKNKKIINKNRTKVIQQNISTNKRYSNAVSNSNGALGFNFNNCRKVNEWKNINLSIRVGKNNCYKKSNVVILPSQSSN
tara:strand:- start:92 stop:703 length:612 start_codon:yes stop_codon:yes gene_type:complete